VKKKRVSHERARCVSAPPNRCALERLAGTPQVTSAVGSGRASISRATARQALHAQRLAETGLQLRSRVRAASPNAYATLVLSRGAEPSDPTTEVPGLSPGRARMDAAPGAYTTYLRRPGKKHPEPPSVGENQNAHDGVASGAILLPADCRNTSCSKRCKSARSQQRTVQTAAGSCAIVRCAAPPAARPPRSSSFSQSRQLGGRRFLLSPGTCAAGRSI